MNMKAMVKPSGRQGTAEPQLVGGYVGAYLQTGLASSLIVQVAEALGLRLRVYIRV